MTVPRLTSRGNRSRPARRPSARRPTSSDTGRPDPLARERKFLPLDLRTVEAEGAFSGYASIFGKADLGGDLVEPGAFAKSLSARGARGIRMLFQHDPTEPIGVWEEIAEDTVGLHVRGRLTGEVARAREVLSLMRAGALDGLSIGFRTVKGSTDPATGIRRLTEIDLWEISVVTFPMLPDARVGEVKRSPWAMPAEADVAAAIRRAAGAMRGA